MADKMRFLIRWLNQGRPVVHGNLQGLTIIMIPIPEPRVSVGGMETTLDCSKCFYS